MRKVSASERSRRPSAGYGVPLAGQSYRTGPYRLTRLTPGYGLLRAVAPAETPRPLGTRRPPGPLACLC